MKRLLFICAFVFLASAAQAQTPVGLAPVPRPVFTQNGAPLVNGCLFSFAAGTSTPLATFADSSGAVSNPNPLVLDANGTPSVSGNEVGIYLSSANYKFQLKAFGGTNCTSGASVWTADNINAASFLNLPNTWTQTQTFNTPGAKDIIAGNMNNMLFVDGVKYTTVQAAATAANALGGGIVMIPDGTYAGPTTWYSNVQLVAQHNSRPDLCLDATGVNCFHTSSANTAKVTFTYSANLTITDLIQPSIIGITLDFQSLGCMAMQGVLYGQFDFTVKNAAITCPALTLSGSTNFNASHNTFAYLGISGGNEAILFTAGPGGTHAFTNANFGFVAISEKAAPVGTYTALEFNSNCDTLTFDEVGFFSGQNAMNGVVFNSASTTADSDANGIIIKMFWTTFANTNPTGKGMTFNPSTGNYIVTGVMNWSGANLISVASGGPSNSPSFTWIQANPTTAFQAQVSSNLFDARSGKTSELPGYSWTQGTTREWLAYVDASQVWRLNDQVNNRNVLGVTQGAPANSLTITSAGQLNLGVGASADSSGFKHKTFGGTTATAASANATATTVYSWTTPFADNNYVPVCNAGGTVTGTPIFQGIVGQTASQVTVQVMAATAVASSFSAVFCIAVHD